MGRNSGAFWKFYEFSMFLEFVGLFFLAVGFRVSNLFYVLCRGLYLLWLAVGIGVEFVVKGFLEIVRFKLGVIVL